MTKNAETFSTKIPEVKLLSPKIIYAKILLIYTVLYTLAFFLGCFVFHSLDLKSGQYVSEILTKDFSNSILNCKNMFELSSLVLNISRTDISHLVIIFMSGFTMLTGIISSSVFVFRGFSFGFSVSYLASAVALGELQGNNLFLEIFVFSAICALNTAILLHFGVKTNCFCDDFKALCGRPKLIIKSKAFYRQITRFLITFGAILILNLIRCVI